MFPEKRIPFATGLELAEAIRDGKLSSRKCLEVLVARMEKLNGPLNAIIFTDLDRARARADEADATIAAGRPLWGPLHGVPMTIKENNERAGHPLTIGNPEHRDRVSTENEVAVQRLEDAGVVIFGKTNLSINTMDIQSYNTIYGTTNNPWDLERTPGGSSGGSAAALAAGMTPIEFGGDVGGSIRIPAAFTGVFGHKPTFGLIPKEGPNIEKYPREISVRGPMARSAADLRVLMELLGKGPRVGEPFVLQGVARAWRLELPQPQKKALSEYRVAIWADDELCRVHDDLTSVAEEVAQVLEAKGAFVDRTARPSFDPALIRQTYFALFSANRALELKSDEEADALPGWSRGTLRAYRAAQETREKMRKSWEAFFDTTKGGFDVLICPSFPTPAFLKDETLDGPPDERHKRTLQNVVDGEVITVKYFRSVFWASLTNVGLLPSTTFPCGLGKISKLPLGLNVVGREYDDMICIDFARLLETECGYRCMQPPGDYGIGPDALAPPAARSRL